jgi:hypothetical protein
VDHKRCPPKIEERARRGLPYFSDSIPSKTYIARYITRQSSGSVELVEQVETVCWSVVYCKGVRECRCRIQLRVRQDSQLACTSSNKLLILRCLLIFKTTFRETQGIVGS